MLVFIVEVQHNNETRQIAALPYMKEHIERLLDTFQIHYHTFSALAYYDPVTGCDFTVHPQTHERLWVADSLSLKLQGFTSLTKEVPRVESACVVEASKFED